jgi:hypothetical protein
MRLLDIPAASFFYALGLALQRTPPLIKRHPERPRIGQLSSHAPFVYIFNMLLKPARKMADIYVGAHKPYERLAALIAQ